MSKKIIYPGFTFILFLIGFFIARMGDEESGIISRSKLLLGTVVEIQAADTDKDKCIESIEAAFDEIKRVENLFSTYIEDSPVWKINNSPDSILFVDPEVYGLILEADSIYNLSNTLFDISLNNVEMVWGFNGEEPQLPSESEILIALRKSGWKKIELQDNYTLLRHPEVGLNFGAIAKGYAVDRAIKALEESSIERALVNAGGDVRSIGNDWIIGIQHPREQNKLIEKIFLNDFSVATSGDYEKYFEVDGKRYHHVLNPKSGYPAEGIMSATVLSVNCSFADALATAVFVMGVKPGLEMIESLPGTEVMIIDDSGGIHYSTGFSKYKVE